MNSQIRAKLLIALSAVTLLSAATDALAAVPVKPGVKRCALLQSQLTVAAKSRHTALPPRVKSLEADAQQFCSAGKTAQGNRAYVKALSMLGLKPDLGSDPLTTGDIR